MRTLTDVFAPGTPLLPEGLRTLQVSPGRVVQPGETVHAQFTFRNLGGGTATGFRVRFRLPEGLTYLVGTATIDGQPLGEASGLSALLQSSGADIGDIPAGSERRVALAYTVATTIENGTPITLQAAISSFEVPVIGSNVVRLVVRSKPNLQNPNTKLSAVPLRETAPGQELQLKAQVHNSGQSSAHDVIVLLPVPANTSYVGDSASVGGHAAGARSESDPFGFGRPTVAVPTLGPGATIDVAYRVRIDPALEDATPLVVQAAVCSQEVAEFALAPVTLKVASGPSFAGPESEFGADCEDEVVPGQRVRLQLRARNVGTAPARGVRLAIDLPEGLAYSAGSRFIDGTPAVDVPAEPGVFGLGDLEPGRSVEVALAAVVVSPQANGHELGLGGAVEWSKGRRRFERAVAVRSAPLFPRAFNDLVRESPRLLEPRDAAAFAIHLANMGADAATDVRVQLEADPGLEALRVRDGERELPIGDDGALHLDTLEPGAPRALRVEARIVPVIEDQAQVRLRATLRSAQLEPIELGAAVHVIASRPRLGAATSRLELASNEVLRPNRTTACRLTLVNDGTDAGRDIRVRLQLPEELRLESVEGASRDGQSVVFGQVPAGESREALVHLRLVTTIAHGDVLEVAGRVSGLNVVPFSLDTMRVATHAEPSFADAATLTSLPADAIDAGAELTYTLALRNSGDGAAKRLTARLEAPAKTVYAPGSTSVNDVALLDFAGTSPLLTPNGLTLSDVGPGVEVIVRLRVIVNTPLPAGTTIDTRARVSWDSAPEIVVDADPVRVRSAAAFQIVEPAAAVLGARRGGRAGAPARGAPAAGPGRRRHAPIAARDAGARRARQRRARRARGRDGVPRPEPRAAGVARAVPARGALPGLAAAPDRAARALPRRRARRRRRAARAPAPPRRADERADRRAVHQAAHARARHRTRGSRDARAAHLAARRAGGAGPRTARRGERHGRPDELERHGAPRRARRGDRRARTRAADDRDALAGALDRDGHAPRARRRRAGRLHRVPLAAAADAGRHGAALGGGVPRRAERAGRSAAGRRA